MAVAAEKLLSIVRNEIGVTEYPSGSNNVKYNTVYYGRTVSGAYPWCAVFLWWAFRQAEAPELYYDGGKTASCPTLASWAKSKGQFVTGDYRPGDLILFSFSSQYPYEHVGMLEQIESDGSLTTIDGNVSLTSENNGGAVMRRTRNPRYAVGAFRPKYENSTESAEPVVDPLASGTYVVTARSGLNVRTGPGTSYEIIGAFAYGQAVSVIGSVGTWYVVRYDGKTGYCSGDYLTQKVTGTYKVTARSGLFVRSGPGTSYSKLGGFAYNAKVTVIGQTGNWYMVSYSGKTGYCSADYLIRV